VLKITLLASVITISPSARMPGEAKAPGVAPPLLGRSAPAKNLKLSKICGCAIMIKNFKVYMLYVKNEKKLLNLLRI
jgi:hypothetical protein